jgi:competence ComEA-like helix-hairpin-helix protein
VQPAEPPPGGPARARDWTTGPARWAAVGLLGSVCVIGLGWSMLRGLGPRTAILPGAGAVAGAERDAGAEPEATNEAGGAAAARGEARAGTGGRAGAEASPGMGRRIDVNSADQAELELLPGIGPALAKRIIEARGQRRFTRVEDLDRVPGIGPKTLERLRPLVTVGE